MRSTWMAEIEKLSSQERQRNNLARPYIGLAWLNNPTHKQQGSPIIGTDTVKGCTNGCFRCYANRISRIHRKVFTVPVRCFVVGTPDANIVYRFGTFGDPATDWDWTFNELDRLRERGLGRFYILTKLQSVEGFRNDPGLCLQVSFDPLNPHQLAVTTANFDKVLAKKVIRLKSIHSDHENLMLRQEEIIAFAKRRNAPILETRFYTNVKEDLRLLCMQGYDKKRTLYKYPGSVLSDCFGLNGHRVCDRSNTGFCRDCLNCLSSLT